MSNDKKLEELLEQARGLRSDLQKDQDLTEIKRLINGKPDIYAILFLQLVLFKAMGIGSPEALAWLTWWHVMAIPFIVIAAHAFVKVFGRRIAKGIGWIIYRVGAWFRLRKENRRLRRQAEAGPEIDTDIFGNL